MIVPVRDKVEYGIIMCETPSGRYLQYFSKFILVPYYIRCQNAFYCYIVNYKCYVLNHNHSAIIKASCFIINNATL